MSRAGFIAALIGLVVAMPGFAGQGVPGTAKADKMKSCVEPTSFMRRNHFELIKHQRDLTVHTGVRGSKHSLSGCIDCHSRYDDKGKAVSVNADGEFCSACHEQVGAVLDCFSCHNTVPTGKYKDAAHGKGH